MKNHSNYSVVTLLFSVVFLFAVAGPLAAQNMEARIVEITGLVELKAPGQTSWSHARQGDVLTPDTMINTGFKSTAVILIGNSRITARALTRLTLAELRSGANGDVVDLNLRVGRIRAEVNPPTGGNINFTVRSPSITASVRGTAFEFDTETIKVENGVVQFIPQRSWGVADPGVLVYPGQSSFMDTLTGSVTNPAAAGAGSLAPPPLPGVDQGYLIPSAANPASTSSPPAGAASPSVDMGVNFGKND